MCLRLWWWGSCLYFYRVSSFVVTPPRLRQRLRLRLQPRLPQMSSSSTAAPAAKVSIPVNYPDPERVSRLDDRLFRFVESCQQMSGTKFGRFLDAGTGSHSLRWMAGLMHTYTSGKNHNDNSNNEHPQHPLCIEEYVAITADGRMKAIVESKAEELGVAHLGQVVVGNWAAAIDESERLKESGKEETVYGNEKIQTQSHRFTGGHLFDTIVADYLIGAMDGFSPYYQDRIIPELARHLAPGGHLYVIGLEPIPGQSSNRVTTGDLPNMPQATRQKHVDLVSRVTEIRDACILLAGHRCYREFPRNWTERQLRLAKLDIVKGKSFPILYAPSALKRQVAVGRSKLGLFPSPELAKSMGEVLQTLDREIEQTSEESFDGKIRWGSDYVICARRPIETKEETTIET